MRSLELYTQIEDEADIPRSDSYKEKQPYCNCKKGKLIGNEKYLPKLDLTKSNDKETCNYCGYYAVFMTESEYLESRY